MLVKFFLFVRDFVLIIVISNLKFLIINKKRVWKKLLGKIYRTRF